MIETLSLIYIISAQLTLIQARCFTLHCSSIALALACYGDVTLACTSLASHPTLFTNISPLRLFASSASPVATVTVLLPPYARLSWIERLPRWRASLSWDLNKPRYRSAWRVSVTGLRNVELRVVAGLREMAAADDGEG